MKLVRIFAVLISAMVSGTVAAEHHAVGGAHDAHSGHAVKSQGTRAMMVNVEAEIVAINVETNEVSIKGPLGRVVTLVGDGTMVDLSKRRVGDRVSAQYVAAIEGEVRTPTEDELANPWVVVTDSARLESETAPGAGAARQIRAVCTIEAADREAGYIVVKDALGNLHTIEDIDGSKFEGVALGDSVVFVYTEALALSLQPLDSAAE